MSHQPIRERCRRGRRVATATSLPPTGSGKSGGKSLWADARGDLIRSPIFIIALLILLVVALVGASFPALWADTGRDECVLDEATCRRPGGPARRPRGYERGPRRHPFGTTTLGCDMYSEIIYGARPSIIVAVMVTAVHDPDRHGARASLSGYYGGWTDTIISRITDIVPRPAVPAGRPGLPGPAGHAEHLDGDPGAGRAGLDLDDPDRARQRARPCATRTSSRRPGRWAPPTAGSSCATSCPTRWRPSSCSRTLYVGSFIAAEATLTFLGVGLQPPEISWGITIAAGPGPRRRRLPAPAGLPVHRADPHRAQLHPDGRQAARRPRPEGTLMAPSPSTARARPRDRAGRPGRRPAQGRLKIVSFDATAPLLQVKDLQVEFHTREGVAHAVNGVNFTVEAGRTLGILGESGLRQVRHRAGHHGHPRHAPGAHRRRRGPAPGRRPAQAARGRRVARSAPTGSAWSSRTR